MRGGVLLRQSLKGLPLTRRSPTTTLFSPSSSLAPRCDSAPLSPLHTLPLRQISTLGLQRGPLHPSSLPLSPPNVPSRTGRFVGMHQAFRTFSSAVASDSKASPAATTKKIRRRPPPKAPMKVTPGAAERIKEVRNVNVLIIVKATNGEAAEKWRGRAWPNSLRRLGLL